MALLQKSQLSEKQEKAIDRLYENDVSILIAPTGAGKTVITLTAIGELLQSNDLRRVVVACPAKVVRGFSREHTKWDHLSHLNVIALDGSVAARAEALARGADVFVVSLNNFDWFCQQAHGCDGVVIDELSKACGKQTAKLKTKKGDCFKWRVGMTATPVSENFQKLYDMCRIMDGGAALGTNKQRYLATYFMSDYMGYNYTLLPNADKAIMEKVKHLIYMVKDEKASELPPIEYKTIEFDMPEETQEVYRQMKKDMVVGDVEAVNAAVKSGKLRQIASGFLYFEDSNENVENFLDGARIDAMLSWAETVETGVIFYEFKQHKTDITQLLDDVTTDPDYFKAGNCKFLALQYQSGGHGLDGLQDVCADLLFYHPLWSRDATEQSTGRLYRTGQKKPVTITTLVCRQSLDPLVMARVEDKGNFMKLFKQHLKEN